MCVCVCVCEFVCTCRSAHACVAGKCINDRINSINLFLLTSGYMYEMRYYVLYSHFSVYCPQFCRHVYHNVSAVVRSGPLQVVGMSNLPFISLTGVDCSTSMGHV